MHWQGWINWYLRKVIIKGFFSFTCLFRLLLEVWRFGACMEFITIGSSVLALPGHSSAQTELCSWLTNFFHCSAQNSLHFGQQTELGPTVFNQCLLPLPSLHGLKSTSTSTLIRNLRSPWKALAFMGAVGKPSGLLYLWLRALSSSLGRKMGKLEASPLNLGPNSIS